MNEFSDSDKYLLLDNLFNLFLDDKYQPEDDELFEEWDIDINSILDKNMKRITCPCLTIHSNYNSKSLSRKPAQPNNYCCPNECDNRVIKTKF